MTTIPPESLGTLLEAAAGEGHNLVRRLVDDWAAGTNRFDGAGEALFGAEVDGTLVGVCGLNVDPFAGDPRIGRVRHLYVDPRWRRHGVGLRLVLAVLDAAAGHFDVVRLRTHNPEAAAFYERLGFEAVDGDEYCTHIVQIDAAPPTR